MKRNFVLMLAVFMFCGAISAVAQATGTIRGVVTDPDNAVLVGATITLTSLERSSLKRTTTTDSAGLYSFDQLAPGIYSVKIEMPGFRSETRSSIEVRAGIQTDLSLSLQVGTLSGLEDLVVITATRSEEEIKDVPSSVSVVTAREFESKGIQYTGYELVGLPSVFVPKNDEGAWTSLTIRGVPERHHNDTFLALLDGIPFVTQGDEVELEFIPLGIIDRVEVVRGPTSALYGRGGVAGAVNYITRRVPSQRTGHIGLNYGSYNDIRPDFSLGLPVKQDKNHLFVTGFYQHKEGWRDGTERDAGNIFVKDQWFIDDRNILSGYINLHGYKEGVASHIPVRADGSIVDVTGGREANYNLNDAAYEKKVYMGALTFDSTLSNRVGLKTTAHYRFGDSSFLGGFNEGFDEDVAAISWNGFDGRNKAHWFFVEPQINWRGERFTLVTGLAYEKIASRSTEDWTGEFGLTPTFDFLFYVQRRNYLTGEFLNRDAWITDRLLDAKAKANIFGAYAQMQFDITSKLFLSGGARFDSFKRSVRYDQADSSPSTTSEDQDSHISPKLSVSYHWLPTLTSYVSFGEGFSPGFGPVWSFGNRNTNLKPEVARNYEIGTKGDLFAKRLFFGATVYRLDRRDLILLISEGTGARTINAGRQQSQGFEFESRYDLRDIDRGLSAYFNYSYTDSVWKNNRFTIEFEGDFDYTGKKVRGVPEHMFSVGVDKFFKNGVAVKGWLDYVGNYFVDPDNTFRSGQHALLNASVNVPLFDRRIDLRLAATNILDREFFYFTGFGIGPAEAFPGLPFQVLATVKYRF